MTSPKNVVGALQKIRMVQNCFHQVTLLSSTTRFVVVYGCIMYEEESLMNLENSEIRRTNILLHCQFVKF